MMAEELLRVEGLGQTVVRRHTGRDRARAGKAREGRIVAVPEQEVGMRMESSGLLLRLLLLMLMQILLMGHMLRRSHRRAQPSRRRCRRSPRVRISPQECIVELLTMDDWLPREGERMVSLPGRWRLRGRIGEEVVGLVDWGKSVSGTVGICFGLGGILAERGRRASEHAGRGGSECWVVDRGQDLGNERIPYQDHMPDDK